MADISITKDTFGQLQDGSVVERFTMSNGMGLKVQILTLGGIIQRLFVPDRHGNIDDIVLGYDTVAEYEDNPCYFGGIVGRSANRIKNGKFTLDGREYRLPVNNGPNHLHGGIVGFHKKIWTATVRDGKLRLSYSDPDGEEGYPGRVDVIVTYELTHGNELVIDYSATSTKPTPINLTNHSYFNLGGHKHPNVYDQVITIPSNKFTPKDENNIPTGEIANVAGSVFDLRSGVNLGKHINDVPGDLGYDHNYCVPGAEYLNFAARVVDPGSGRVVECYTASPGIQLYTANYVDIIGKDRTHYKKHSAFCLETQNYPNAINQPNFPNAILRPGEMYSYTAVFRFATQ